VSRDACLDAERRPVLSVYRDALAAVHGGARVRAALERRPPPCPVHVAAVGKAAGAMAGVAFEALRHGVRAALVVTRHGYGDPALGRRPGVQCLEAGHPVPDADSLAAGRALLEFLEAVPAGHRPLLLISGGASSLVERPPAGVTLADLVRLNHWLLGSGLDIRGMNRVRCAVSTIKGGRLAARLGARTALALLISDVRGDDPAVIGSGLAAPGACEGPLPGAIPAWAHALVARAPPAPRPHDPACEGLEVRVVARLADALEAAATAARGLGAPVHRYPEFVAGDPCEAGRALARRLRTGAPGFHIRGGEPTPVLPPHPGRGGRCQSLALAAALELQGEEGVVFLAASTDGSDGPGEDAGALVDGGTVARGVSAGYDAARCLAAADAGSFLAASGDLVQTGPTGTNVMDLFIGWKRGPAGDRPLSGGVGNRPPISRAPRYAQITRTRSR